MTRAIVTVHQLDVTFPTHLGPVSAVRGVSFEIGPGETVGLVGESGCGKSVTAHSLMGLLGPRDCRMEGEIHFGGHNLVTLSESVFRTIRGKEIGMVFQDPMTSLNPTMRVGAQIMEGIRRHQRLNRSAAREMALHLLERVGIAESKRCIDLYPYELSGGMRQRILIAMAVACRPRLLIADEPTTALDVTVQSQVLDLLQDLQKEIGTSILLITHDLGVVARLCDRVLVMYAGQIVEKGPVDDIFYQPAHPYTRGLLASMPSLAKQGQPLRSIPGSPPNLLTPPQGCAFASRCSHTMRICTEYHPPLDRITCDQRVGCWLHDPRALKKEKA